VDEAVGKRSKRVGVLVLPAGRDRGEGAAVKRTGGGDHLEGAVAILGPPLARKLDRRLVGFGSGVTEEDARRERQLNEATGELDCHGVTIVPMPASVNSSSRSACLVLPSTMCASGTPSRARRHASSLGIIPPVTSPFSMRWRASSFDSTATTSPSTPWTPGTSVSRMTFAAPSATAIS